MTTPTILYLSHGGGPLPLLGDAGHREMVSALNNVAAQIQTPSAILVISAHWEEERPTVTSGASPALVYDYYGFPEESYHIQYPCAGAPAFAQRVHEALKSAGFDAQQDDERGFDHGLFVPLKIMYPDADIPCIQLSLLSSLDAEQHIQLGEALRSLQEENLLVIGSGFSFHNMRAFFAEETDEIRAMNEGFDAWLNDTCLNAELSEAARRQRLVEWDTAPHARYCHPREEHLLPLQVCYGLAQRPASTAFHCRILGKQASMFLWQPA
ncbi:MAG: dioxygenase [Alcanivoracaceae bacterium]|nr:dioxygenase [Alcanivoracaceae bacterium]